jgi:hypothetical protein
MTTKLLKQEMSHGSRVVQRINTFTEEGHDAIEAVVADSTTDQVVTAGVDVSALKLLFILATQDMTLEWNDAAGSQGSIALKANRPLVWDSEAAYYTNPLGGTDVTQFFITNVSGAAGVLYIDTIIDITP